MFDRIVKSIFVTSVALFTAEPYVFADGLISPIPQKIVYNGPKAALGKQLFMDPRLSKDGTVACVSCHDITAGGAENSVVSTGIGGQKGIINSPTVFNAVNSLAQFWDGRAKTLKEQVFGPLVNPVEMGNTYKNIVKTVSKDPAYQTAFQKTYPNQNITIDRIADAIAEFEKTLLTPNSRFDSYLRGKVNALNQKEKEGYLLFKNRGCIACHNGVNIGGNMFQRFGVFSQHKDSRNALGRYRVTGKEEDKYFFKVPSLRNIAKTAPYFHDGSAKTLHDAVHQMGDYQLGRELPKEEIEKIVAFLKTLNGELPKSIRQ